MNVALRVTLRERAAIREFIFSMETRPEAFSISEERVLSLLYRIMSQTDGTPNRVKLSQKINRLARAA